MVLLIKKSSQFPRKSNKKLDQSQSIALKSFQSYLSESLNRVFAEKIHGSSSISLNLYIPSFKLLQGINRAFSIFLKDLDYPIGKWKGKLAEDYLSYSLNLLDVLNSISSSISHVGISRLTLTHAISLIPNSLDSALHHLKPIKPRKIEGGNCKKSKDKCFDCDKEKIVHEAMMKMKGIELVIFRVLLCGLSEGIGDLGLGNCVELESFDFGFDEKLMVKEIEKVNDLVKEIKDGLIEGSKSKRSEIVAQELKKMLEELENLLEMVNKEVQCLFSEVMAKRNELIDCLRLPSSS